MGLLKKKSDPVSERARALNSQIAALEREINALENGRSPSQPRLRSTVLPRSATQTLTTTNPVAPAPSEPVFEDVDQKRLKAESEHVAPAEHFNELGVRKYDLVGLFKRIKSQFTGPSSANAQFVNLMAAGSVQGLRAMRYEKRVARNRLVAFVIFLFLILLCVLSMFIRNR